MPSSASSFATVPRTRGKARNAQKEIADEGLCSPFMNWPWGNCPALHWKAHAARRRPKATTPPKVHS